MMIRVTNAEFWARVGEFLMLTRTRRDWNPIDVQRHGGPNYATVQAVECGKIGMTNSLEQTAEALGLTVADVFRAVLEAADTKTPPSPEALIILRKFETADVKGRRALLAMAEAIPDPPSDPETPPTQP